MAMGAGTFIVLFINNSAVNQAHIVSLEGQPRFPLFPNLFAFIVKAFGETCTDCFQWRVENVSEFREDEEGLEVMVILILLGVALTWWDR